MFLRSTILTATAALAFGVTPLASGGKGGGGGTATEITLRIPNETAPAGGLVQMKVLTTEVTPISGGRAGFDMDNAMFDGAAGFSIAAPNGEAAGAAVVHGMHVQVFYSGTSLLTGSYPILTTALRIRSDVLPGSQALFTLAPTSLWNFSTMGLVTAKISAATVSVAGTTGVAISDVVPGEGVWPAGTVVSVQGVGFSSTTSLRVNGAGINTVTVVSPTEIQFTLTQATDMRGLKLTAQGPINASIYYAYMRGITSAISSRTLLRRTEPIFGVVPRTTATFGPMASLSGNQYAALALQNPTAGAVIVSVASYWADGTLAHQSSLTLESRHRLALELSELLDGVAPSTGGSVVVTASAPIDVIGLLCDEGAGTIVPTLPIEAQR
jgi:hypothetical protein